MPADHASPAPPPMKIPSRRRLLMVGAAVAAVAAVIAGGGAVARVVHDRAVAATSQAESTPTVALATLDTGPATGDLTLPGTVEPFNRAAIYARVSGYLKTWRTDIGAHVKAGEMLATIDTPDLDQQLEQAKADLASATANDRLAELTAHRWDALVSSEAVARQAADEKTGDAAAKKAAMDAASANVRRLQAMEGFKQVVAPFDGIVTARNTDLGALINAGAATTPGQELFEVSDLHRVRIYVQVPQTFAAQLRPGLQAKLELPQYPGRSFAATLVTTSDAMRAGSASMLVELQADNANGALQAGSYAQVRFELPSAATSIRIPATALAPVDTGAQVALVGPDGRVVFRKVQIGHDFGDSVEIIAGLAPGDRVIDNPPETLQPGDLVRLANASPAPAAASRAGGKGAHA
jgi:RND family efflux transporter MFP subunit